jgi:proteasome maturation protein
MDAMDGQLPFMRVPHDTMREGLPGAKAGVTHLGKHPVQIIQEQGPAASALEKRAMLANTYGIAMPARMDIEAQILGRQKRLPGLPSSNFGAEILSNDVDRFGFESYLDNPADRTDAPRRDLHAAMELKLGMDKTPGYGPGAKR